MYFSLFIGKELKTMPTKPRKDLSKEKEATLCEMFDYLCSKIIWEKTFLDAVAIRCMNTLFIELGKDKRKFDLN